MASRRDDTREGLRASWNEFARQMVRLPLSIIERLQRVLSCCSPQRNPQDLQPQQQGGLLVIPEEWFFLTTFEQEFGSSHPFFYACQLMQALKIAEDESKFGFMYLHAPDHPSTAPFCRDTLCTELVVEFLDRNFVSWGAVASRGEGLQMALGLKAANFPFFGVIAPASSDSIVVLRQVEGPVSPEELVGILHKTIEEQGAAFSSLRAEEERRANRQLREEQDAAYLISLTKDKEKDRGQQMLTKEGVRAAAENQRKANYERQQKKPAPKQLNSKTREAAKGAQPKEKEIITSRKTQSTTKIVIRFPNGERKEKSFLCTDTIRSIYKYIDSLDIPGIGNYQLISNFPQKVYGHEQLEMTLKDAGLNPSATLFLELLQ